VLDSQLLYEDVFEDAQNDGIFCEGDMYECMKVRGLWSDEKQSELDTVLSDIDKLKVGLYDMYFRGRERESTRKMLAIAKEHVGKLMEEKHMFDYATCEGIAYATKLRYLVGSSLYLNKERLWESKEWWNESDDIIDNALLIYHQNLLTDEQIRDIALSEPWSSVWANERGSAFPNKSITWTENQKRLAMWAALYDNIRSNPDCPSDEIIKDHDTLDGWLLKQRKAYEERYSKKRGEELLKNPKIKQAGEVYIPVNTKEDAKRVEQMNDPMAARTKKQRFNAIRRSGGKLHDIELPDVKQQLMQEITQKFREQMKGRG